MNLFPFSFDVKKSIHNADFQIIWIHSGQINMDMVIIVAFNDVCVEDVSVCLQCSSSSSILWEKHIISGRAC